MNYLFVLSFLLLPSLLLAQSQTPICFSDDALKQSKHGTNDLPEVILKRMMKDLPDRQVFARLVLAETYASTCPSPEVAQSIAWVIKNRLLAKNQVRYGLGREVVFKPYQFRSSTGDCDVAKRSLFLCPTSMNEGWEQAWKMAMKAVEQTDELEANPLANAYQYFFYQHFDESINCAKWKGVIPDWANKTNLVVPKGYQLDTSCVAIFR